MEHPFGPEFISEGGKIWLLKNRCTFKERLNDQTSTFPRNTRSSRISNSAKSNQSLETRYCWKWTSFSERTILLSQRMNSLDKKDRIMKWGRWILININQVEPDLMDIEQKSLLHIASSDCPASKTLQLQRRELKNAFWFHEFRGLLKNIISCNRCADLTFHDVFLELFCPWQEVSLQSRTLTRLSQTTHARFTYTKA